MKGFELENCIPFILSGYIAAHRDYCGSMNVKEFYREDSHHDVNEESICKYKNLLRLALGCMLGCCCNDAMEATQ